MRGTAAALLGMMLAGAGFAAATPTVQKRPNIVFIIADDLSWKHLGAYGSDEFETSNIDRLAAAGQRSPEQQGQYLTFDA